VDGAPPPWITTLYMFRPEPTPGQVLLAGGSFSGRTPGDDDVWWPIGVGAEAENSGNVLVLKSFPATVTIGVRVVAYGDGGVYDHLRVSLTPQDGAAPLTTHTLGSDFPPLVAGHPLGIASTWLHLRVTFAQPAAYWLTGVIGRGPELRIPLLVLAWSEWMALPIGGGVMTVRPGR
jgi:hypothetical protein